MNNNNIVNMVLGMINSGGNPNQIAMNMLNNNPQAKQIMQQFQNMANGMSPKDFALQLAKQKGVNPDEVMKMANKFGLK